MAEATVAASITAAQNPKRKIALPPAWPLLRHFSRRFMIYQILLEHGLFQGKTIN
jgi:hypothetical protein